MVESIGSGSKLFFKHADTDADDILDIVDPIINEYFLYMNCSLFKDLQTNCTHEMMVFCAWHMCIRPEYYAETMYAEAERLGLLNMQGQPRREQIAIGRRTLELMKQRAYHSPAAAI